jgi:membrane protein implicated in regulation of membrane protease activity
MNTPAPPLVPPGQDKRIVGSLLLALGVGLILETSYQWSGIGIILISVVLVMLGWKEQWQRKT